MFPAGRRLVLLLNALILFDRVLQGPTSRTKHNSPAAVRAPPAAPETAKILNCVPLVKVFMVELAEPLRRGEGVGLTGDHDKLGGWQVERSLEMKPSSADGLQWHLKLPLCARTRLHYRFFVFYRDGRGHKRIRRWEGQQHARVLEPYQMYRVRDSTRFGEAHAVALGGGAVQQERGWLRHELLVQLKFIWPQHIRFTSFVRFVRAPDYLLRLEAFEVDGRSAAVPCEDCELEVWRNLLRRPSWTALPARGVPYKPGGIVVFHLTAPLAADIIFKLSICTRDAEVLGEAFITSAVLSGSDGILDIPILAPRQMARVGWLTLPYLLIRPLPSALRLTFRASFHHYWPPNWPPLDVGHRGMGKSFYRFASGPVENTIRSFLRAHQLRADMVELDVHLTSDYVPVVWQDFGFYSAPAECEVYTEYDLDFVLIQDLTYAELKSRRVFVNSRSRLVEVTPLNDEYVALEEQIFPRLEDVYRRLPPTLGLLVEVKWPQLLESGQLETVQPLDKNLFVDALLHTTFRYGCGRPLVFASFDADICSMLRYKQHSVPVLLLTVGQSSGWEPFADLRTRSFTNALNFAQTTGILGVAAHAADFLGGPEVRTLDRDLPLSQVLFLWGDALNQTATLDRFRARGVAGLIYDRPDVHLAKRKRWQGRGRGQRRGRERKRSSFFGAPELTQIFVRQCVAAGNTSFVEGEPDTRSPFLPRLRSLDEL